MTATLRKPPALPLFSQGLWPLLGLPAPGRKAGKIAWTSGVHPEGSHNLQSKLLMTFHHRPPGLWLAQLAHQQAPPFLLQVALAPGMFGPGKLKRRGVR